MANARIMMRPVCQAGKIALKGLRFQVSGERLAASKQKKSNGIEETNNLGSSSPSGCRHAIIFKPTQLAFDPEATTQAASTASPGIGCLK